MLWELGVRCAGLGSHAVAALLRDARSIDSVEGEELLAFLTWLAVPDDAGLVCGGTEEELVV